MAARLGLLGTLCSALAAIGLLLPTAASGSDFEALEGRTVRIIASGGPGSTSDLYARAFAATLEEVVPEISVGVQSITGAAGALALKTLMESRGDLLSMAVFNGGAIYNEILGTAALDFDIEQIRWVGVFGGDRKMLGLRKGFGTSFEALRTSGVQPLLLGSSPRSLAVLEGRLINAISGSRMRIGSGFDDGLRRSMILAGDGDVLLQGVGDLQALIESGDLVPVLRYSGDGYPPQFDSVPTLADIARPGTPSELLDVMRAFNDLSQFVGAAPSTDPVDMEALRAVFDHVVEQSGYVSRVEAQGLVNRPTSGIEVTERVTRLLGLPEASKQKIRAALDCGEKISSGQTKSCD